MKNSLTQAGIEPATLRFVAQHLNHCTTAVPTLCIMCMKLIAEYFFLADVAFRVVISISGLFCILVNMVFFTITASHFFIRFTLDFLFLTLSPITGTGKMKVIFFNSYSTQSESPNYKKSIIMTVKHCADQVFCYCERSESHCLS